MFKRLAKFKKQFTVSFTAVLLIFCALTFFYGSAENKLTVVLLTLVLPFAVYGFAKILFKVLRSNASKSFVDFTVVFFFAANIIGLLGIIISFVVYFPNGLSPTLGAAFGLFIELLDE